MQQCAKLSAECFFKVVSRPRCIDGIVWLCTFSVRLTDGCLSFSATIFGEDPAPENATFREAPQLEIHMFRTCNDSDLEPGYEKVGIYGIDEGGHPRGPATGGWSLDKQTGSH